VKPKSTRLNIEAGNRTLEVASSSLASSISKPAGNGGFLLVREILRQPRPLRVASDWQVAMPHPHHDLEPGDVGAGAVVGFSVALYATARAVSGKHHSPALATTDLPGRALHAPRRSMSAAAILHPVASAPYGRLVQSRATASARSSIPYRTSSRIERRDRLVPLERT